MLAVSAQIRPQFGENHVIIPDFPDFDLAQTLDCGQAFRWKSLPDGSFLGVAGQKICQISRIGSDILLEGVSRSDFEGFWYDYFDLGRDYAAIRRRLAEDPVMARALAYAPGIRVLRQQPWEALASFIISQNNNIKRIKGIIDRLCETFGDPLPGGLFTFPGPERLAPLRPEDLAPLRAGFRARYLIDAAQKVSSGRVDLPSLEALPLDQARAQLLRITGVGGKVADCALLFGCGRIDCFPLDVWMKRVMAQLFPQGLPPAASGCAGIAQQYLFHYARTCPDAFLTCSPPGQKPAG